MYGSGRIAGAISRRTRNATAIARHPKAPAVTVRSSAERWRSLRREPIEARDDVSDVRGRALGPGFEPKQRRCNVRCVVMHRLVERLGDRARTVVRWPVRARVDIRLRAVVMTDERCRVMELAGVRVEDVRDLRLVAHREQSAGDEPQACNRGKRPARARSAPGLLQMSCK